MVFVYSSFCRLVNVFGSFQEVATILEHQKHYYEELVKYDGRFKDIFEEVYDESWKQTFEDNSTWFVLS
ncbi:hypothetical protein C1H46_017163 [Malus baccata]|uniref:Uncharacterized protein n=1 Tax=Malus baccata TaxID=106549 RepID=A0A540MF71_MALBA|nr:hypothetical protein C1H46_017163 [Malus baccata]